MKFIFWIVAASSFLLPASGVETSLETSASADNSLWTKTPGNGFQRGVSHLSLNAGIGIGMRCFGGRKAHDWALGTFEYGCMLGGVKGEDRWYAGNWELVGEAFGGVQYSPSSGYIVGATPLLRYNFAVGHRLVPFIDGGAGITATDIRDGDLSTTFEFNSQVGAGLHILVKDDVAITLQYRFYHISNAGIQHPNDGVNSNNLLAGITCFF